MDENDPLCCLVERARRFNLFGIKFGPEIVAVEVRACKKNKSTPKEWYYFWFDPGGVLIDSNVEVPNTCQRNIRVY
ncbi:hypothetical protein VNPA120719_64500 [Pseudomonas aeruginosa]|mgnify:FL=1|nr:hypothetical protein VNPA110516_20040 [Pseudomonas aeruginosa]GLE79493.1 hypothetical protein VNPA120641_63680 [Pseudomonas aeruginosa]GLE93050.1 hypothetical protein VNPA120719_64500 [Pseudomonas aeruginosa]